MSPFYERDSEGKLVPVIGEVPEAAITVIERFDEEAIAHRLTTGIASDSFIYHYPIKTATGVKEIVGVSTDGADEIARMLSNLEVLPDIKVDKDSDPDYFYVMVRVKDLIRNVTLLGTGRACKYQIGKGNQPDHDRPNEWAFVSSVSKAQRNAILRHTPEEAIIKIINTWLQKGKSKQLKPPVLETENVPFKSASIPVAKPPTAKPPTAVIEAAPTETEIAEQQEKLKNMRMQVHNRFQTDLGIGLEKRKSMLVERFNVDSLTDLSEQQLEECLSWVEEMIEESTEAAATKPSPAKQPEVDKVTVLGFKDEVEHNKLRGRLYTMLTTSNQLNLKDEEAKEFISDRGYSVSTEIPKERLLAIIREIDELIKAKQTPTEF